MRNKSAIVSTQCCDSMSPVLQKAKETTLQKQEGKWPLAYYSGNWDPQRKRSRRWFKPICHMANRVLFAFAARPRPLICSVKNSHNMYGTQNQSQSKSKELPSSEGLVKNKANQLSKHKHDSPLISRLSGLTVLPAPILIGRCSRFSAVLVLSFFRDPQCCFTYGQ